MAPGVTAAPPAVVRLAIPPGGARLSPAAALVAARAEARAGRRERALALLLQALPAAGPGAPVLRVEAAQLALELRRDPYPHLAPLLAPTTPRALRRRAEELAIKAAEQLPLPRARTWLARPLPQALRREIHGALARRADDRTEMLKLIAENPGDVLAGELARVLSSKQEPPPRPELLSRALFVAGYWRESSRLLDQLPYQEGEGFSLTFLRARAAYRLEAWEEAISWFARAEKAAANPEEKASCWLFAARAWEQLGREACAEELYRRIVALRPEAVEGWTGLLRLLARKGDGTPAVVQLGQAPPSVQRELAPRLCATLVLMDKLPAAEQTLRGPPLDPAAKLCAGFLALHRGQFQKAQSLFASVVADPKAGRLRELVGLALPHGWANPPGRPARELGELSAMAAREGLAGAREALRAALQEDPAWAPLLRGTPAMPALPAQLADFVEAGLQEEVATLLPHLLPQGSPAELAWSAAFLAEAGNCHQALRLGEKLWRQLGPFPAFLLPDELLSYLLPPACAQLVPEAPPRLRALMVALARQESRFDARASSPVGARGIWQLVPATVARLAPGLGAAGAADDAQLALRHLELSAQRLGFDPLVLAAAYNAGQAWVELWLEGHPASHPLFALAVPYAETRGYLLGVVEGLFLARHLR